MIENTELGVLFAGKYKFYFSPFFNVRAPKQNCHIQVKRSGDLRADSSGEDKDYSNVGV